MSSSAPLWLDEPAREYGRLAGDETVDVGVIGGGVTGLACARVLARAGLVVRVLEARRIGSGASGRNGGFALRGTSAPYDRARLPDVMRLTEEALVHIRGLAGDAFRAVGSLRVAVGDEELVALRAEHDALAEDGFGVEWRERDELPPVLRGLAAGGIFHPTDGAFEQGAWIRRLAALACDAGARLAEETAVTAINATSAQTAAGTVRAGRLVIATDGYTDGLVPELDVAVVAVRGQVLATEPLPERLLPCPIYARWGYDYMQQLADRRLVVGGQRDADLEGETTRVERTTDGIQALIEAHARSVFGVLPRVTHRWAGLMGFTDDYLPLVGELPGRPAIWVSVGYSGHGNVLGFACGEAVARAILGDPDPRLVPLSPERIQAAPPPA
ncbi:MAG TPA: FAD-dependent oxidoreductase [Gaiellaceae bacterium]|nr:FAD-dependent oxidoreductase [Gaiellaceae bacterium]